MTNELIAKAKECKSPEELLALAKENNIEMTEEEAKAKFAALNSEGELSENELDSVSGGGCESETLSMNRDPEVGEIFTYRVKKDNLFVPMEDCVVCGKHHHTLINREGNVFIGKCCSCGNDVQVSKIFYEFFTVLK